MKVDVLNIMHLNCTNSCLHCGYGGSLIQTESSRNDFSNWLRYMDWAKENEIPLVVFSGGDPTEHAKFKDIAHEALWRDLFVQVETHGQKFENKDMLHCFGSGKRFSFVIPVHGATEEVHDRIVGKKGAFKKTIKGIRNIKEQLSSKLACMSVIQSKNVNDIPRIAELCLSLGADQYFATLVQPCGAAKKNETDVFPKLPDIEHCIEATALVAGRSKLSFNNVPFCLMGNYIELSINFPISNPVGEAFELLCYPADPKRDYVVLKTLFPKRPTCATCFPGACSRFLGNYDNTDSCNDTQRNIMEIYCRMCDGCFFNKVCPGLPLSINVQTYLSQIKKINSADGLNMMANNSMNSDL